MASTNEPMGRLERVDLREAWETEDGDFTPWLAQEENIALLGDAIGIDLEVEAQEKQVGPFRADILCLDTATTDKHWVLIENQLYRTDHTHLGQLITYAAGLDAVTIIWIAGQFTDEHRAALDWLNEITDEEIRFFGIEVELWRIGNSPPAPKFNIVSEPNDWTKSASIERRKLASAASLTPSPSAARWRNRTRRRKSSIERHQSASDYTSTQRLQIEYWGELQDLMQQRQRQGQGNVKPRKGYPQNWQGFAIGKDRCILMATVNFSQNRIGVELLLEGDDSKKNFALLWKDKDEIELELGRTIEWSDKLGQKQCSIGKSVRDNCDLMNRDNWPDYLNWMCEELESLYRVFAPRIKTLDVSDYIPDDPNLGDTEDELV